MVPVARAIVHVQQLCRPQISLQNGLYAAASGQLRGLRRQSTTKDIRDRDLYQGTGPYLETLEPSLLPSSGSTVDFATTPEYICSYSVLNNRVFVPGNPARYKMPSMPANLADTELRKGSEKINTSAVRVNCVSLPKINPTFDFSAIDIYCSANVLRSLLGMCEQGGSKSYRFHAHLIEQTMMLSAVSYNHGQWQADSPGRRFEAAFTRPFPGIPKGASYVHTVRYSLGHLQCAVWSECDAFASRGLGQQTNKRSKTLEADTFRKQNVFLQDEMVVVHAGKMVQADNVIELKTVSYGKWTEKAIWPKMWLTGVQTVHWGYLTDDKRKCVGVKISKPRQISLKRAQRWQDEFDRLCTLLSRIRTALAVSKHGICIGTSEACEAKSTGWARLDLWEPEFDGKVLDRQEVPQRLRVAQRPFPEDFVEQFWIKNKGSTGRE
ncbi:hypothetical protein ACN47E_005095 [Coniothyrium glycines]